MKNLLFLTLGLIGSFAATIGSQACFVIFWDEPQTPKSLIK